VRDYASVCASVCAYVASSTQNFVVAEPDSNILVDPYTHTYKNTYMCVCVCVCVYSFVRACM